MSKKIFYVGNPATRETVAVIFENIPDANTKEAEAYVGYVLANTAVKNTPLVEVTVKLCADGNVDVGYLFKDEKFERIRRITGR